MAKVYVNGKSKCQKHFRNKVDINRVMRKHGFNLTGLLSSPAYARPEKPRYVDFTGVADYHTSCNKVSALKSEFDLMPVGIKKFFENDIGRYIEFMYNVSNPDPEMNTSTKAVELGLIKRSESPDEVKRRLVAQGVAEAEIAQLVQSEMEKKYPLKPKA